MRQVLKAGVICTLLALVIGCDSTDPPAQVAAKPDASSVTAMDMSPNKKDMAEAVDMTARLDLDTKDMNVTSQDDSLPQDQAQPEDMPQESDASSNQDLGSDASLDQGEQSDATACEPQAPGSNPLSEECTCDCQKQTLSLKASDKTFDFGLAVYGLTSPQGASNEWEIYIESFDSDAPSGCATPPIQPRRTLILNGLSWPALTDGALRTQGSGVIIDFQGDLVNTPPFRTSATSLSIQPVAAKVCTSCSQRGKQDPDGFVSLDVTMEFPEGQMKGRLYATHCKALDQVP